jgi:hypothetical protein
MSGALQNVWTPSICLDFSKISRFLENVRNSVEKNTRDQVHVLRLQH